MAPTPPPAVGDLVRVAETAALDRSRLARPLTVREADDLLWSAGCDGRPCGGAAALWWP